jgi:phosphoglycolate phosphatase-like HAD superfamily hydrolase
MQFQAVVFDLDGCLIDSAPNLIATLGRALAETGGGRQPAHALRRILGLPCSALNDFFDLPDWRETLRLWCSYYAPLAKSNRPFDGILPLLAAIKAAGLPLGIATSQGRELFLEHFHKYPVAPFFDLTICADDVANPKPAADPLLYAAEVFGVPVSSILFLGDAVYDMQCARAAGASGALAVWGTADRGIPADYYPETPLDVLKILSIPEAI